MQKKIRQVRVTFKTRSKILIVLQVITVVLLISCHGFRSGNWSKYNQPAAATGSPVKFNLY